MPQQQTLLRATPTGRTWPSEVLLLRASDRGELLQRAGSLADHLEASRSAGDQVELVDLAFTLNTAPSDSKTCVAVVAGSTEQLETRLRRAAERLADPACRQIYDAQGIYYFDEPLYAAGRVAWLFPGEGAQYLNMLADLLPHFPEVREHFERCDRVAVAAGRRRGPITASLFLTDDATAKQRAAAETRLAELNNAAAGVLAANWAVYGVLERLGLRPDAVAGHSSGEISALAAAGCIAPDDHLFGELAVLGQRLEAAERAGEMADTALLAVAAGRDRVSELIGRGEGELFLAMDNCPHQTVVGGAAAAVEALEERLRAEEVVCERLPFGRPYHTPLFQPHLEPLGKLYAAIEFRPQQLPIYSCTTGRSMPRDPDDIRCVALSQWTGRVEFAKLIEAMYADGLRLFVEVGPRGNLTSFVQDILRGRQFLAAAANVHQRDGLTQLNHLVAQLAAHGVPLRLEHLYERRDPHSFRAGASIDDPSSDPPHPNPLPMGEGTSGVLARHFAVMSEFLDLQRDMHRRYLDMTRRLRTPVGDGPSPPSPPPRLPMIGQIVEHRPSRSLLMRRRIDLGEDLYAGDHTLGGRDVSAVDPQRHGLAVMPMALNLEMMAEAAALLLPSKVVVGFERVRLQRWVPLHEEPVTVELKAEVQPHGTQRTQRGQLAARPHPSPLPEGEGTVVIQIRDLGNATQPGNAESPAVEGTVLLADRYPEPPAAGDFPLTNPRPCRIGPDELYRTERRLFHGPLFQAVAAVDRMGDDGIEGELVTLSHARLFRSTGEPNLLLDPILIDASTHVLGAWHLSQEDQSGRVVFPYELGGVQFFGPRPAEGTRLRCRVRIEETSARQVSHCIELVSPDGRLWCRLSPAQYWRFYWPAECVAFFRHHEEHRPSRPWPDSARCATACHQAGDAVIRYLRAGDAPDLVQPVIRAALARASLSPAEWQEFYTMTGPDRRRTEWLFGRIAAKDCVRALWQERNGQRLFPADIEIEPDPHGRPVARYRECAEGDSPIFAERKLGQSPSEMPGVSIAHSEGTSIALAAFGCRVGIDIEPIRPRGPHFEEIAFDLRERELLGQFGSDRQEDIARFWCAKEAVAKALGRGLVDGPLTLMVREVDRASGVLQLAPGPRLESLFPELRSSLIAAWTDRQGENVIAAAILEPVPKNEVGPIP